MFFNIFKDDFKRSFKPLAIYLLICIVASVILRILYYLPVNSFTTILSSLYGTLYTTVLSLSTVVTVFITFFVYYKTTMTDESYLIFSLPVSRKKIINAKLLLYVVNALITMVVLIGCLFIATPSIVEIFNVLYALMQNLGEIAADLSAIEQVGYIFIAIALVCLLILYFFLTYYTFVLASLIARRFKKFKLGGTIILYYVFNQILSVVGIVFIALGLSLLGLTASSLVSYLLIGNILLWLLVLVILAGILIIHFININYFNKKLNIE